MFESDYIMRQIEGIAKMLGQLVFHKKLDTVEIFDEQGNVTSEGLLWHKLKHMIILGQINEAENLLFAEIEETNSVHLLPVAVAFYRELAELSEKRLAECNYSAEEIVSGLQSVEHLLQAIPEARREP